jgi:glycosyltransferase involved in cell wall biosynthesis
VLIIEQGGRGGVADYTGRLADALAARGLTVRVATCSDHLYRPAPGIDIIPVFTYLRDGSPVGRLVRRAKLGRIGNGLLFLATLPRLCRLARRHAVVHVQGWEHPSIGVLAMLALRASGARIVYTAHNTFKRTRFGSMRVYPPLARVTIVHTEADRANLSRPVRVIAHGHYGDVAAGAADADPAQARERLGLPADGLVVLLFGVLRPDKGLGDLLSAVAGRPEWTVLVAGEEHGALAAAGQQLEDPRLRGRVRVKEGFLPIDAVGDCFAAADVVALPYHQASQSGVLHLAYGFAKPVIAYPVGGLVEALIEGETGWLCAAATPTALEASLAAVAASGRSELARRGLAAREWSRRTFDWAAIAEATEAAYESALVPAGSR